MYLLLPSSLPASTLRASYKALRLTLRCLLERSTLLSFLLNPLCVRASRPDARTPLVDEEDRGAYEGGDRKQDPCRILDTELLVHWPGVEGA